MKKTSALFITGTDTNVGKTFVTELMLKFLRQQGLLPRVFKPVCCGGKEDVLRLMSVSPEQSESQINGFYFEAAATPSVAAAIEGKSISAENLLTWCNELSQSFDQFPQLWEGAGGWMVPLADSWCVADWAEAMGLPIILVVAERLGCLNHTLLTVRDIERRGLRLAGVVLNRVSGGIPAAGDHREVLEKDFALPVWGRIEENASELPQEIGIHLLEAILNCHGLS